MIEAIKELWANKLDPAAWNEFLWPILFDPINSIFDPDPRYMLTGVFVIFVLFCIFIRFFTHPLVAGGFAAIGAFIFIVGLTNPDFQKIIFKGDNVPIVIMLVSVNRIIKAMPCSSSIAAASSLISFHSPIRGLLWPHPVRIKACIETRRKNFAIVLIACSSCN